MHEHDRQEGAGMEHNRLDEGWLADREARTEAGGLPENEAYDNAETFGQTLLRYADTVQYVNALYPDQMDVNEARQALPKNRKRWELPNRSKPE